MYLERFKLDGKIALVTGGAQGIGHACVEALGEAGALVVIADKNHEAAAASASALSAKGLRVEAIGLDVTDSAAVEGSAASLQARHGRIDVLVNNAGIARSNIPAESMSDDAWLNVLDVNLNGLFWCCRAFGSRMLAAGSGVIVNVGSMSGFIVNRPQEQANYNASKAAVHHVTRSLAAEWAARGLRVNAVAPTYIETPLTKGNASDAETFKRWIDGTPMGRMGRPDEIASVVLFLASDASSLMTGSIVLADGGYCAW